MRSTKSLGNDKDFTTRSFDRRLPLVLGFFFM
jgi:hypothetical protein